VKSGYHTEARAHWVAQGRNLMTPIRLAFHDLANGWMVEVSEGTGLFDQRIFGVSVADARGEYLPDPVSRLFQSREDADEYVARWCRSD